MFRSLKSDEIDVRIGTQKPGKGVSLLLYKDARADMIILDETVGCMNWKREHTRDNHNCIVSIWDKEKNQWISKEDTGKESNSEAEKGLASDSFKRACVNWGIGRELYTSPFIWVNNDNKYEKYNCYHIKTEKGVIKELGIKNSKGDIVFKYFKKEEKKEEKKEDENKIFNISSKQIYLLNKELEKRGVQGKERLDELLYKCHYKKIEDIQGRDFNGILEEIKKIKETV